MKIGEVLEAFKSGKIKEELVTLTFYANPTSYSQHNSGPSNPFSAPAIMPWECWQIKVELNDLAMLPDMQVEVPSQS